jgi:succinate dehydrogenase/fumarate reductase iron-sulfur protein
MADIVTAKISKFDPATDEEPRFASYEVPWIEDESGIMSGLQVLNYIHENIELIGYDWNCRGGICGRCAMTIDGEPHLACWKNMTRNGEHTFEPLAGFPVIRDLVVDKSENYRKFVKTDLSCQTLEPITELANIPYDFYWNTLDELNMCRECMSCYAACPKMKDSGVADKFIGPGAMMQIAFRHFGPYDDADRVWQAVFSGLFECDLCGECNRVCPSTIDIVGNMNTLQEAASARNLTRGTGNV